MATGLRFFPFGWRLVIHPNVKSAGCLMLSGKNIVAIRIGKARQRGYSLMRWSLPALLFEAGLIDYLAIHVGGVSDWCVSPAYWFLIPTYACLWYGGRWYAAHRRLSLRSLGLLCVTLFVTTSLAFLISNGSFYLFSERYATLDWAQYGARIAAYYPPYLLSAFAYVACAVVLHGLLTALHASRSPRIGTGVS